MGSQGVLQKLHTAVTLHPRVLCAQGSDSAACKGQHSACPGSSPRHCVEKLWVAGQVHSPAERVLCGSGSQLLTAPAHPEHIPEGTFQEGGQGKGYLEWKELSF